MSAAALRKLAPVFRRRFGVFTTADAAAVGVSPATLVRMVRAGDIERLYRGVYAVRLYPDCWQRRWMAGVAAAGPHAAISHHAAAHLHGLEHTGTKRRPRLQLTTPRATSLPTTGVAVHTQVHLCAGDIVDVGNWRVTGVAWTLASLAYTLGPARFERAVGAAIARNQTTSDPLAAVTARFRFCSGVLVLREVLSRLSPEIRMTRSEAERLFLRLVTQAGLPMPEVNLRIRDARGGRRYLDFAWPEWSVCVEIDVHPDHEGTIGRNRDGRRQNDLVPAWTPLRFDDLDLQFDAGHVIEHVTRTLRAAGAPVS